MPFDLKNPRLVVAGNAYGECRGGGRIGMSGGSSGQRCTAQRPRVKRGGCPKRAHHEH